MYPGRSLQALSKEVVRQSELKRDFIVPASLLTMDERGHTHLGTETYETTTMMHTQIATRLSIPHSYYNRMRSSQPNLLATNVNTWLSAQDKSVSYMVRTLETKARALLSDRYRPLDNYDLMQAVLPSVAKLSCNIESCEITETRLYLKAVIPSIQAEVSVGDVVQSGFVISNSEIGYGAVRIEPFVYRLICKNGAIINELAHRKAHIGRQHKHEQVLFNVSEEYYKTETREADDKAFWMKVRDVIEAHVTPATFETIVKRWKEAKEQKITGDPVKVVEVTAKQYGLSEMERVGVLHHLIDGHDLSAYGLMNAVTRTAADADTYDRATELERLGPEILELDPAAWRTLAAA